MVSIYSSWKKQDSARQNNIYLASFLVSNLQTYRDWKEEKEREGFIFPPSYRSNIAVDTTQFVVDVCPIKIGGNTSNHEILIMMRAMVVQAQWLECSTKSHFC